MDSINLWTLIFTSFSILVAAVLKYLRTRIIEKTKIKLAKLENAKELKLAKYRGFEKTQSEE